MGTQRLTCVVLALALAGCPRASGGEPAAPTTPAQPTKRHAQIVRAATTKDREAVFARFRERNGAAWASPDRPAAAVDPIRLVVRRAARNDALGPEKTLDASEARATASSFVRANADLFGVAADDLDALVAEVVPVPANGPLGGLGQWAVAFTGKRPMRGYEGFDTIATLYEISIVVGKDGTPRVVENLSRIHPRLSIDTTPNLPPDDRRVQKAVVGRELFFVRDDPRRRAEGVRALERVSLGRAYQENIKATTLHVHVSVGPMAAYVGYYLAYAVDVERGGHFFRFIVDADSGDLLDDAVVPVVAAP